MSSRGVATTLPDELLPEDPRYYYSSLLPFRQRLNPDGSTTPGQGLEWAVPGALRGLVNQTWLAGVMPGNALAGKYSQADMNRLAPQAALGLLGASSAGEAPEGALRMFLGPRAQKADLRALQRAQEMAGAGHEPNVVRQATGWFQGADKKWRFEIPDNLSGYGLRANDGEDFSKPTLNELIARASGGEPIPLENVLDHPELYEQYPWLRQVPVTLGKSNSNYAGVYDPNKGTIVVSGDDMLGAHRTALHEVQHGIQHFEGFAAGSNPEEFLPEGFGKDYATAKAEYNKASAELANNGIFPSDLNRITAKLDAGQPLSLQEDQVRSFMDAKPDLVSNYRNAKATLDPLHEKYKWANQQYYNTAGEIEARATEDRHMMDTFGRNHWNPMTEFEQHPPENQLVLPWDNPSPYLPKPEPRPQPRPFGRRTQLPSASFTGYHGTPYTFEPVEGNPFGVFADDAMSSGTGAQMHGWGHYVTSDERAGRMHQVGGAVGKGLPPTAGSLYQLHITPEPEDFLHLDQPLANQSKVAGKLEDLGISATPGRTGRDVYNDLSELLGGQREASQALARAGVAGNRYRDALAGGTTSYVVFDPKHIKILARNGQSLGLESVEHDPWGETQVVSGEK